MTTTTEILSSTADFAVDEYDDRPLIKDLLEEKSSDIDTVRNAIQSHHLYEPSRYDDIWILRYVLSHKKDTAAAIRAAVATMEFRKTHKLNEGDLRAQITHLDGDTSTGGYHVKLNACAEKYACLTTLPDENRGLVMYIFLDKLDMKQIDATMTQEELKLVTTHLNESMYQVLDSITRKTGRLTKLVKLCDMKKMKIGNMNRAYLQKDAAAAKEVDDYFPQLLGGLLVANPPKWISIIWKFMRPLMPTRITEKVDFLPANNETVQKRLSKYVSKQNLLERYGGENKEWPPLPAGSYF